MPILIEEVGLSFQVQTTGLHSSIGIEIVTFSSDILETALHNSIFIKIVILSGNFLPSGNPISIFIDVGTSSLFIYKLGQMILLRIQTNAKALTVAFSHTAVTGLCIGCQSVITVSTQLYRSKIFLILNILFSSTYAVNDFLSTAF